MGVGNSELAERSALETRRRYFPAVEGMRAVAALLVLFGHVLILTHIHGTGDGNYRIYNFGNRIAPMGVIVFFVISGFLIYRPFIAARGVGHSVRALVPSYAIRRAVRILPAYWVAITLLAIWPGVYGVFGDHWWVCYGLLQIYSPDGWGGVGLSPAWSLCVEVTFYLALPFAALLLQNRGVDSGHRHELRWELCTIAALAAISLAVRSIVVPVDDTVFLAGTLLGTFSWFCVGMLLAAVEISPSRRLATARRLLGSAAICWPIAAALFVVWIFSWVPEPGNRTALHTLGEGVQVLLISGLLVAPAIFGDSSRSVRLAVANRTMVYLGTVSYGIYLYHWTIADWLSHQPLVTGIGAYTLTELVFVFPLVVVLASLSWFLVERPLMRRVKSIKALRSPAGPRVEPPAKAIAEPAP